MSHNTFCLDIGEKYIKVIDVDDKKKALSVRSGAFNEIPFNLYAVTSDDYDKKAAEHIRKLVTDSQLKKTDVRIVIPDSQSYTRVFEMPFLTDKELISAIKYQADQFIPIPIDKVSLDLHIINKDKQANKTHILLVAAPKVVIDHVVKITEDAGLVPENIQNESSAVLSLISRRKELLQQAKGTPVQSGTTLYINFGNSSTSLYLYDDVMNYPLQVHNFSIGLAIFYKEIQANFSVSAEQIKDLIERIGLTSQQTEYDMNTVLASPLNEFASEIQRFILSSKEKTQQDINGVYMIGEGTRFAGFDQKISAAIGLPVQLLNLTDIFEKTTVADYFTHDWPILASSIGANLY